MSNRQKLLGGEGQGIIHFLPLPRGMFFLVGCFMCCVCLVGFGSQNRLRQGCVVLFFAKTKKKNILVASASSFILAASISSTNSSRSLLYSISCWYICVVFWSSCGRNDSISFVEASMLFFFQTGKGREEDLGRYCGWRETLHTQFFSILFFPQKKNLHCNLGREIYTYGYWNAMITMTYDVTTQVQKKNRAQKRDDGKKTINKMQR